MSSLRSRLVACLRASVALAPLAVAAIVAVADIVEPAGRRWLP